jgi:hypothetical protein
MVATGYAVSTLGTGWIFTTLKWFSMVYLVFLVLLFVFGFFQAVGKAYIEYKVKQMKKDLKRKKEQTGD